jgi:hypothetical protein
MCWSATLARKSCCRERGREIRNQQYQVLIAPGLYSVMRGSGSHSQTLCTRKYTGKYKKNSKYKNTKYKINKKINTKYTGKYKIHWKIKAKWEHPSPHLSRSIR